MTQASSLLELQAVDLDILRSRKRLDELPEKRAILEIRAKQREVTTLRGRADLLVRKLESDLKAHQDEITSLAEKIDAEQVKVMNTSDHRAVTSITREMDGLRRRRDKLEMESLSLMERVDKARAQTATIDDALVKLATKEAAMVAQFQAVGGELQAHIGSMETERTRLSATLPTELIGRYESAREAKGGVGVGRLDDSGCTACRMALPTTRVDELLGGPDIGVCPQCRRLIVVRTGDSE